MTPEQVLALGVAFAAYLKQFEGCFVDGWTVKHLHTYCRGLLSDLPRKSVEPIALAAGCAVRTLQEFLKDHVWDRRAMRDRLHAHVAGCLAAIPDDGLGTVGLIDETSVAKKGRMTPGVQRQYCGAVGKQENCVVTVHLGVARAGFKALLDSELFLPKAWSDDRPRCRQAGVPDDLTYSPKWRLALGQLIRALGNGLLPDWMTFDEGYGCRPDFLAGLDALAGLRWVGEVPRSFSCLAVPPRGKRPRNGWPGKRADSLARFSPAFSGQPWQEVTLTRQTQPEQRWQVKAAQVYLMRKREPTERTYWLIVARNRASGEVKYFASNAAADAPLGLLLRAAFVRWNVEHAFRLAKGEIGFGHYEGRSYTGMMRHLTLCLVTLGFVAGETDRLRGEKPTADPGAGVPGAEPALRGLAGQPQGDVRTEPCGRGHRVSPAEEPGRPRVATATPTHAQLAL
jgi:SRSO17 transposase